MRFEKNNITLSVNQSFAQKYLKATFTRLIKSEDKIKELLEDLKKNKTHDFDLSKEEMVSLDPKTEEDKKVIEKNQQKP